MNTRTAEQIIRTASITCNQANKYGINPTRLKIDSTIQPMKVYNKVTNNQVVPMIVGPLTQQINFNTKYVTQFIQQKFIAVNMINSTVNSVDPIIYGQGKCTIQLNRFDNIIKFVFLQIKNSTTEYLNISGINLFINFIQDNDQVISIPQTIPTENNDYSVDQSQGETLFCISRQDASKILKIKNNTEFCIVEKQAPSAPETILYRGTFVSTVPNIEMNEEEVRPFMLYFNERWEELLRREEEANTKKEEYENLIGENNTSRITNKCGYWKNNKCINPKLLTNNISDAGAYISPQISTSSSGTSYSNSNIYSMS